MTSPSTNSTSDPSGDIDTLASAYVLGTLPLAGRLEVQDRLPRDPELRQAVQAWEERLHPLTALAPAVEPSAALWPRIERSLGWSRADVRVQAPAAPSALASWWNDLRLWRGLAGGGFAAAAVLAAVLVTRMGVPGGAGAPQYMVVLVAPGGTSPGWVVQAAATSNQLQLTPLANTPVPQGKSLQFWTKADQWSGPKSLGLVQPGESVKVPIDRLPPLEANQLFELTLEPEAGSPIDRPTGPIVFIGRAVKMI
ncbi:MULTISPECIES: anti-sigma factor domain-containing protein [unclassified Acidovorax]|uniref:anti-sigma factor n=1 Tax=unclassified Acidovorax TaxID=2684926 RepID=UPI002882EE5F|nr:MULTISPECIES: anti-sigma factor [unclassified Acidovorax]